MLKSISFLFLSAALLLTGCTIGQEQETSMKTRLDSIAYAVGMDIGKYYHEKQGIDLDPQFVYQGFRDIVGEDSATQISEEQGMKLIDEFARMMEAKLAATNEINQETFLQNNLTREEVSELEAGIQYEVIREGTGASPRTDNVVKIKVEGHLLDGTIFASSSREAGGALEIDISQAVPGLQTALTRMKPGDAWRVWIPSALGYGDENRPPISPNSLLIYDLELLEIVR